jgi:hypothetical protein
MLSNHRESPQGRRLTVGILKNSDDFNGAGCLLWSLRDRHYMPGKYVFASDYEEHAAMNINGRDAKLKLVDCQELRRGFKVGDHSSARYRGDGFDVEVVYTVTGVCKPDDEQCEVTDYNATITVRRGSTKQMLTARNLRQLVFGLCGRAAATLVVSSRATDAGWGTLDNS